MRKASPNLAAAAQTMTLGGKIGASLFLGVFLLMGLFFLGLLLRDAYRKLETRFWRRLPCEVLASAGERVVKDEVVRYFARIDYRYTCRGRSYTSSQVRRDDKGEDLYETVQRWLLQYPAANPPAGSGFGSVAATPATSCWVNPDRPEEAVLVHGTAWLLFAAVVPLIFVGIGGGGIYFVWRGGGTPTEPASPVERARGNATGAKLGAGLGRLVIAVAGTIFLVFCLPVFVRLLLAQSWQQVPCRVLASMVECHSDSDGSTYSADIFYTYSFGGREYGSNRYHFMGGSSSGRAGKVALVARYPAGRETVCYVNPRDPTLAVLERGWQMLYLVALIPLGIVAVVLLIWRGAGRKTAKVTAALSSGADAAVGDSSWAHVRAERGPRELKPSGGPGLRFLGIGFFALFWNGIIAFPVVAIVKSFLRGRPEWFPAVFISIFVLIGIALLVVAVCAFLALFNPRPRLRLEQAMPHLGEDVELRWKVVGRASRFRGFTITFEGREEASYRRGTSTATDKNVFHTVIVLNTADPREMQAGRARLCIPATSMHSFAAPNNKIVWTLTVKGEIPLWPDVKEEFEIAILPAAEES